MLNNHDPKPKNYVLSFSKNLTQICSAHLFLMTFSTRPPIQGRPPPLVHQQFPPAWVREDIDLDEAPEKTPMGPLVEARELWLLSMPGESYDLVPVFLLMEVGKNWMFYMIPGVIYIYIYNSSSRAPCVASLFVGMLGFARCTLKI